MLWISAYKSELQPESQSYRQKACDTAGQVREAGPNHLEKVPGRVVGCLFRQGPSENPAENVLLLGQTMPLCCHVLICTKAAADSFDNARLLL